MKKILHLSAILFLAFILIFVLRSLFFCSHPVSVQFEVETQKNLRWQIFWTSVQGENFNIASSLYHDISAGSNRVKIELPTDTLYKLRLDPGSYPEEVTIKNLSLVSGDKKLRFDNFEEFAYVNLKPVIRQSNCFKFVSLHLDPYAWFSKKFEFTALEKIDWFALSIITILSLLLSSVIVNTAKYVMARQASFGKRNVVFCGIICCLLVIPVSNLNQGDILVEEKRKMATFPKLLVGANKGINYSFGKNFDSFLSDRFTGRRSFIKRYNEVKNFIDTRKENKMAIQYPNGWMFCKPWVGRIFRKPSPEELDEITSKLVRLKSECDSWGTRLYLLICPIKEDMYSRFHLTGRTSPFEVNTILEEHLRTQAPQLAVIYPRSRMQEMCLDDDKLLFYKTDTHQNMDGAYLINDALIKRIASDYPITPPPPFDAFNIIQNRKVGVGSYFGNGFLMSSLQVTDETLLNTKWNYYELRNTSLLQAREDKELERYSKYENGKGVGVLLGDSFTENQAIWLQYSFNELYKWRANNAKENNEMRIERWRDKLSTIKPDVLVICVSASDSFFHLKNLYKD